jgi:hypothetical protein
LQEKKIFMMTKTIMAAIALSGLATAAYANTALDPSFTSGFSSDYAQVTTPDQAGPGGQWVEGTYAINTDPYLEHGFWSSFSAPNGGNMLIVNGATTAGLQVWDIQLNAGTYDFSALEANNYASWAAVSPADLVLELNGTIISSVFENDQAAGNWETWTVAGINVPSGGGTLAIVDLNTVSSGNDFSLAGVPDGGMTSLMLGMGMLGLGWVRCQIK